MDESMGDISVVPHPIISEIGLESDDLLPERQPYIAGMEVVPGKIPYIP